MAFHGRRLRGLVVACLLGLVSPAGGQRVDTVRVGSASLRGARLAIGAFTMESFQRAGAQDTPIGTTTQAIVRDRQNGQDVYAIRTMHTAEGDTTQSVTVVQASDFRLVHHHVKAPHDSATVSIAERYVTGWVVLPDEPTRLIDQHVEHPVFPVEGQFPWLFPLLPLADGYRAAIPYYSEWEAGETWMALHVIDSDQVVQAGEVLDCWRVDGGELFPGYRVTYWIAKDTHRLVQGVARGSPGEPEYWSRVLPS